MSRRTGARTATTRRSCGNDVRSSRGGIGTQEQYSIMELCLLTDGDLQRLDQFLHCKRMCFYVNQSPITTHPCCLLCKEALRTQEPNKALKPGIYWASRSSQCRITATIRINSISAQTIRLRILTNRNSFHKRLPRHHMLHQRVRLLARPPRTCLATCPDGRRRSRKQTSCPPTSGASSVRQSSSSR